MLPTSRKEPGQPWMKRRGMALGRGERWWTKCRGTESEKFEPGWAVTVVANYLNLAD
jgi:hypothetical protein